MEYTTNTACFKSRYTLIDFNTQLKSISNHPPLKWSCKRKQECKSGLMCFLSTEVELFKKLFSFFAFELCLVPVSFNFCVCRIYKKEAWNDIQTCVINFTTPSSPTVATPLWWWQGRIWMWFRSRGSGLNMPAESPSMWEPSCFLPLYKYNQYLYMILGKKGVLP